MAARRVAWGALAIASAGLALVAAAPPARRDWNAVVARTPQGTHLLGSPAASVRLTEFVSYTCPHCAEFEREAEAPLRLTFVAGGQGSIEVRHFVRDPVDMTVALLTNCGPPAKFFANHTAFLRGQAAWIGPLTAPTPAQRARWTGGAFAQRTRAIAQDFGFYPIMRRRGYTPAQVDRCLADEALAERLAA
ncbi:MAG: thioredoxin domain-containing protein, partial [Novosphingobium sp.]